MSEEHERNPICKEISDRLRKEFDAHIADSPSFRDKVVRHDNQIDTMKETQEQIMEDIEAIKASVDTLRGDVKDYRGEVKLWVMSGIVSIVVLFAIPTLTLFYSAGQMSKQIEINTKKLEASK